VGRQLTLWFARGGPVNPFEGPILAERTYRITGFIIINP